MLFFSSLVATEFCSQFTDSAPVLVRLLLKVSRLSKAQLESNLQQKTAPAQICVSESFAAYQKSSFSGKSLQDSNFKCSVFNTLLGNDGYASK